MKFGTEDLYGMPLSSFGVRQNRCKKGLTVLRGVNEITYMRVSRDRVDILESKERPGCVCVLRHGALLLHSGWVCARCGEGLFRRRWLHPSRPNPVTLKK